MPNYGYDHSMRPRVANQVAELDILWLKNLSVSEALSSYNKLRNQLSHTPTSPEGETWQFFAGASTKRSNKITVDIYTCRVRPLVALSEARQF